MLTLKVSKRKHFALSAQLPLTEDLLCIDQFSWAGSASISFRCPLGFSNFYTCHIGGFWFCPRKGQIKNQICEKLRRFMAQWVARRQQVNVAVNGSTLLIRRVAGVLEKSLNHCVSAVPRACVRK